MDRVASSSGAREVLGKQRELYAKLLGMSRRQVDLVNRTRTDELLSLLAEKQLVLAELGELQEKLSPVHPDWEKVVSALSEQERGELRKIAGEIAALLEDILRLDEEGRQALGNLRDQALSQLKHIGSGKKVLDAYKQKDGDEGVRFVDETS